MEGMAILKRSSLMEGMAQYECMYVNVAQYEQYEWKAWLYSKGHL